jgi:type IV pilus assembly protein PilM
MSAVSTDTADRLRSGRTASLLASPPPGVAIEIAQSHVTVLALDGGREPAISGYAVEPLPAGAVIPALNAPNVNDAAALTATLKGALQKVAPRARRVAVVLPDSAAKVSLIRFDKVPAKTADLDQLIRWQIRKTAPFRIEDAQVAWFAGVAVGSTGREFVVTLARRDIVESFERACEAAGVHAGLVSIASFSLINAHLAAEGQQAADWLLVHVASDYVTLAVVRGPDLVFFRNRAIGAEADLADMVHQTAMYHEDRLGGGGFARVVLAGASLAGPDQAERLRRGIEERLGGRVELLDVRGAATLRDRISVTPALLDTLAAPVGILAPERGRGKERVA